jgi:hypothetical protein
LPFTATRRPRTIGSSSGFSSPLRGEQLAHRPALLGLDVDDEAVGRIRRHAALPGGEQVVARQGEQQQRGHAEAERHGLDHAGAQPPRSEAMP